MLVQLAEGMRWPSCSSTGATAPRSWSGLGGRSTSPRSRASARAPQAGILGATIKLASLPAAFAALYRVHDVSPDLASALLDMNGAAFVSTFATWALLLGAAGAVMLRTGRCGARWATSRSPPPAGAREHPELHLRRPAHVHAHVRLEHRHQRVATPPWRAHRRRRRSRRAGHRLTPLARCASPEQ
jgi:hypothetical protein